VLYAAPNEWVESDVPPPDITVAFILEAAVRNPAEPDQGAPLNNTNKIPRGFESPVAEPTAPDQTDWQNKNRSWWESNPMRYDWNASIVGAQFSREFFQEIDKRFFSAAAHYTPPSRYPFDELVPFDLLPSCDVLEIGVGNGSHAQLFALDCKSYVCIDLTAYAFASTCP